mgnify:FL=1
MVLNGYDTAAITSFDDAICEIPSLVALRDRVLAVADENTTETQGSGIFTLKPGSSISVFHDLAGSVPYETRAKKVKAKAATLLGQALMEQLWAVVDGSIENLNALAFAFEANAD